MSAIRKPLITPEEYLTRERAAEFKSEYFNGEVFAMAGARHEHVFVRDNLAGELHSMLKGTGCRAVSTDMRVCVSKTGLYTYPDIAIVCGKPEFADEEFDTLMNPSVIIEVLSPSTENYDRVAKFAHYRQIATLREYVLVSQNTMLVETFSRKDDGTWAFRDFSDPAVPFELATISISIPLVEIYRDVTFPEQKLR